MAISRATTQATLTAKRRRATDCRIAGTLTISLVLLSGCTTSLRQWTNQCFKVGPEYASPAAPAAKQWIDSDNPQVNSTESYDGSWWTAFNDPVLDGLVARASQQNLRLREAGARILEARARLAIAQGNLFPQAQEVFGTVSRTQMSRTTAKPIKVPYFDDWATGFNASWELDFWGRFRRGMEASEADLGAAIESCHGALVILQAEVAAAYIQVRVAQERITLAEQNVELQKKTLAFTELRFSEGKTTKLDVTQARANLATTQTLIPQLETALRESQNALCVLLSVPPYNMEAELGSASIPDPVPEVAVGIPAQLLTRRPDVRTAERLVAAQSARIGIAESDLYPRIAITGTIGYESMNLSSLFQGDSFIGNVGPGFQWNILNYGRIRNNIRAEEARLQQLVFDYQDVVIKAHQDVENGINRFLREQERVNFLEEGVAAASESVELAGSQYRVGKVDFQRLVNSQRALVLLQDQLTAARGQVATNLVQIYKALGGGWQATYVSRPIGEMEAIPSPGLETHY